MRRFLGVLLTCSVLVASAAASHAESVTESDNKSMGNDGAASCIAQAESGGKADIVNYAGYLGKYQVGEAKLIDTGWAVKSGDAFDNKNIVWSAKAKAAGINSTADFLANPAVQDQVKAEIDTWNQSQFSSSAKGMIGSNIDCSSFGGSASTPLTMTMLIQGAQFGAGKVNSWAQNGGSCVSGKGTSTNDGNGNCVTWGMCHASNCSDIQKDSSKNTCGTTMSMIKSISCSNYTGESLALCNYARPYLMTDGECSSAESMAKAAPKGPNEKKCENLSFGPGTGSWSFVLACSYASSAVADQDGVNNNADKNSVNSSTQAATDPECIQKLKGMGVEFSQLGEYTNGSYNGTTCVIQNPVSMKGTALPFGGATLTMNCDMALAMETFSQQLKGIGITGYYGIGSTRPCGPMRDKTGNKPGTITNHAIGRAVDFSGFIWNGHQVSMGKIWEPGTPDGQMASKVKDIACSVFRGVLSPTYKGYVGAYFHNHVEVASGHFCR